jgi:uncharacterized surface protein with fasciclin (FAS1) repeats
MRSRHMAAVAAAVSTCLATAACTASTAAAPRSAARHIKTRQEATRSRRPKAPAPGTLGRPFGTGCNQLPHAGGVGTARGLARVPVETAMAQVPILSELVHAIALAGLAKRLNTAPALTIFAPDNEAFQAFGTSNLQALYSTRPDLVRVLTFQIVAGRVRPAELARQRVLTTLGGTKIYPSKAPPSYYVNNAWVSCGNLPTANATVYIVNRLVVPAT